MKKKKFAFLIHPRGIDDLYRRLGSMLGMNEEKGIKYLPKIFPRSISEGMLKRLKGRAGFTVCSHFDVLGKAEGYIIAVLLTGRQISSLPRHFVKRRILDAVLFAQNKLGVSRIGLGAYTSPYTYDGRNVVNNPKVTCAITHGDSLASASAVDAVQRSCEIRGVDFTKSTVAVVGAYGIIGRGSSLLLSKKRPKKMILTGPNIKKLKQVRDKISMDEVFISKDNSSILEADIILLTTTAPGAIVSSGMLKQNAIVVDMAQPYNLNEEVCRFRPDVFRIDGGYMSIPVDLRFDMGPPADTTFACLTETMVSTLVQDTENHVGPVNIDFANLIYTQAKALGFNLAPLTNFSKLIPMRDKSLIGVPEKTLELAKN